MISYSVISLGDLINSEDFDELKFLPVLEEFSCSRDTDVERFLKTLAIRYQRSDFGKTFLIIDDQKLEFESKMKIIAFFTLGVVSLDISQMNNSQRKAILGNFPKNGNPNNVPAFLIAQFGRSDSYFSEQLPGTVMMKECFSQMYEAQKIVGGRVIVLDCKEQLIKYYEKSYEFKSLGSLKEGLYSMYRRLRSPSSN